ncbi:transcriptional regulator of fucose utilization, GntR family [Aquipluma nitroreducens]|uniref:Transcriptional regulator of fucose utilization, GntR family n=1 Tax=Aquipluma nitroreducens TaxID=2010828 RepID=A0A5K7SEQ7_9BACT|nr:GntR family transcriptional regulator [Aquipluma nitroreducens]BBE19959.1 transcriptional regulator of fucose utilization, GntR family [Aquipluma nitroreducens]
MKYIQIDDSLGVPKYRQIINSIYTAISIGELKLGDKIPSLNQICTEFELSRDTVMVAFNELKAKGIINSIPGKGYYINSIEINVDQKIFLLFDELNAFKEDLYTSFLNSLDNKSTVDIYFHHFNYQVFKDLISESAGKYTSYVIMPATFDYSADIISKLPKDKVYILDRLKDDLSDYPVVYQDFEQDVYDALNEGLELLQKYNNLIMIYPGGKEPEGRMLGFQRFCKEKGFKSEIIRNVSTKEMKSGEAYFVPSDRNLVRLVKMATEKNLELGRDVGIVSFNDTVLKEVVAGGITIISTDFQLMGQTLARMIQERSSEKIRNQSSLIRRNSL